MNGAPGTGELAAPDHEARALSALRYSLASDIVELIVLTGDQALLATLREAVGPARRLWHVPSPDQVSGLLIAGGVGILVIDVHALYEPPGQFITEIKRQFPDLVILVSGPQSAQVALAPLISSGAVYRYLNKPVSPNRARLFADAAVKRYGHIGRRESSEPEPRRPWRRLALIAIGLSGTLAAAAVLAWHLSAGKGHP